MSEAAPSSALDTAPPQRSSPTLLWLVRHAEVEAAYHNIFGGRIDMDLSPRGLEQAAALGKYLRGKRFDAVYASPMKRVLRTLSQLERNGWPEAQILQDLREVDFGDWTGHAWAEIEPRFGVSALSWLDQLDCGAIPNAECGAAFVKRVRDCVVPLPELHPGKQVLVVCHGGVIRGILSGLLGFKLPSMALVEIEYASITQLSCSGDRRVLEMLNFTPWRDLPV